LQDVRKKRPTASRRGESRARQHRAESKAITANSWNPKKIQRGKKREQKILRKNTKTPGEGKKRRGKDSVSRDISGRASPLEEGLVRPIFHSIGRTEKGGEQSRE